MTTINLTKGITDNDEYKAFKFPGGEIHFILKQQIEPELAVIIQTRLNSSDDIMLLLLVIDTLRKDFGDSLVIRVNVPYMPYQQADRNFGNGECFSLRTVIEIFNSLNVYFEIFDPHSDVTPGLLKRCIVKDNSKFISNVLFELGKMYPTRSHDEEVKTKLDTYFDKRVLENTIWLSPDAGAYKKINKLADKIGWLGPIAAANKYRNTSSGNIDALELSTNDFEGKDVLIIDDICMGGRTFIELAKKLKERNVGNLYLAISHMVGGHPNGEPNEELGKYFKTIFTTNSRKDNYWNWKTLDIKVYNVI